METRWEGRRHKGMDRRTFIKTVSAVATMVGFPAIIRGAEEKRVVLYCPESPDLSSKIGKAFEAETGIKVDVQYGGTNVIVNRLLAERSNPNADVLVWRRRAPLLFICQAGGNHDTLYTTGVQRSPAARRKDLSSR